MSDRTRTLRTRIGAVAFVAACLAALASAPALAASIFEKNGYMIGPRYDSAVPACDNSWALSTIQSRFASKEGMYWNSALQIVNFDRIREIAFRPWADATIPRRWCTGRALISDGLWRTLRYSIIEDGGMIGANWGVEWCVVGIDRNWAYNPICREAAP